MMRFFLIFSLAIALAAMPATASAVPQQGTPQRIETQQGTPQRPGKNAVPRQRTLKGADSGHEQTPHCPRQATHPRDKGSVHYGSIGGFCETLPHYYGYRTLGLPSQYRIVRSGGTDYIYSEGVYFLRMGNECFVCRPPVGMRFNIQAYSNPVLNVRFVTDKSEIDTIAANLSLETVSHDGGRFCHYDDGVFFKRVGNKYVICHAPSGAVVENLPEDNDRFTKDGQEYFRVDNTVFIRRNVEGVMQYIVVGQEHSPASIYHKTQY